MTNTIDRNDTLLVVVDVQEKMMKAIHDPDRVIDNICRLVRGCRTLNIPILVTEHYSKGLMYTVPEVQEALGDDYKPLEKITFSAAKDLEFMQAFEAAGRQHILVCGVETHICVYQTARDLHNLGWTVEVVADAVSSRTEHNTRIGLDRLKQHSMDITSVEMALFDMMETADIPEFKTIAAIIK